MIGSALLLAAAPIAAPMVQPCAPAQLSLGFDGENGAFDGMSHAGALLVVRNLGARACTVPARPALGFLDAKGAPLPIAAEPRADRSARAPVAVAPGAELTAALRWVSGAVYGNSRCLAPASARLAIGAGTIATAFAGRLCGPAGTIIRFEQGTLRRDPVLAAGPLAPLRHSRKGGNP